jgi:hypothetical protein
MRPRRARRVQRALRLPELDSDPRGRTVFQTPIPDELWKAATGARSGSVIAKVPDDLQQPLLRAGGLESNCKTWRIPQQPLASEFQNRIIFRRGPRMIPAANFLAEPRVLARGCARQEPREHHIYREIGAPIFAQKRLRLLEACGTKGPMPEPEVVAFDRKDLGERGQQ